MLDMLTLLFPFDETGKIGAALSSFWLGYIIILLVPGPSLLLISFISATHGMRAVVPMSLALGCGAASLFAIVYILADIVGPDFRQNLSFLSVILLFFSAYIIARARLSGATESTCARRFILRDIILGLTCGFANPVTGAYFTAVLLGESNALFTPGIASPLVVGVFILCAGKSIAVAALFSTSHVRQFVMRHFKLIKTVAAVSLVSYGVAAFEKIQGAPIVGFFAQITTLVGKVFAAP